MENSVDSEQKKQFDLGLECLKMSVHPAMHFYKTETEEQTVETEDMKTRMPRNAPSHLSAH